MWRSNTFRVSKPDSGPPLTRINPSRVLSGDVIPLEGFCGDNIGRDLTGFENL